MRVCIRVGMDVHDTVCLSLCLGVSACLPFCLPACLFVNLSV